MFTRRTGFTVVEILIVIVVIAILASLSYVGYTSITNRASDTSIKTDLAQLGKQVDLHKAEHGTAPTATIGSMRNLGVSVAKNSYDVSGRIGGAGPYNLLYCTSTDNTQYVFVAWSKSGNGFMVLNGQLSEYSSAIASRTVICPALGLSANSNIWLLGTNWQL